VWLEVVAALAVGGLVVVGLAALLARVAPAGAWQRTLWQASTLGLAALLVGELTGVAGGLVAWVAEAVAPVPRAAAGKAAVAEMPPLGPADRPGEQDTGAAPAGDVVPEPAAATVARAGEAPAGPVDRADARAVRPQPARREPHRPVWWPGAVWLAGTAAVVARLLAARLLLAVVRRRHRAPVSAALGERVRAVARRLGLRRRVQVLEIPGLLGPAVFGVVRPALALPARFEEDFGAAEQEAMLAHELAHLAARDPAWHLLADLVAAALWWHPLAWWSRHRLRAASEAAADEASLVVAGGPGLLAACLVEIGTRLARPRPAGGVRMAGSGFRSSLGRRVERLVRLSGRPWRPLGRARIGLAILLGPAALLTAALLSTAWTRPQAFPKGDLSMKTMQHWWQHSLAGIVVLAALGPGADTAPGEDPPDQPAGQTALERKADDEKRQAEKAKADADAAAPADPSTNDTIKDLQRKILAVSARLGEAEEKAAVLQKAVRDYRKTEAAPQNTTQQKLLELQDLRVLISALQAYKAQAEAELNALKAPRIRVFRLSHRDPDEMRGLLEGLVGIRRSPDVYPGGSMMPGGVPYGPGSPVGPGGMPDGMDPMGTALGLSRYPGFSSSWRLAVDKRTRSLIVRGTPQDLQTAADLIAVLDLPPGKPLPQVQNLRAFQLRHADAANLAKMLAALEINARIMPVPRSKMLIVSGPEAAMKEISEVITALDVDDKAAPPKAEPELPKGAAPARPADKKVFFEMRDKPWSQVLEWLSDITNLPVLTNYRPTGTFTFLPPGRGPKEYTLAQVIDILNEGLLHQKYLLIRRAASFTLVPADERVDPALVPRVSLDELDQRGNTELVSVLVRLTALKAEDIVPEVRKLMGPFGEVVLLAQANALVLQDTAGNLKRIHKTLQDIEVEKARKLP
jgi:type II secretory pathway component GspD/PulD (secretin)